MFRMLITVSACAAATVVLVAVSSAASPSDATTVANPRARERGCPPLRSLVLIGDSFHVQRAKPLVEDIRAKFNTAPAKNDAVVFVVRALDGPMPQTRERLSLLRAKPYRRSAILLVDAQYLDDPELRELVIFETRELLEKHEVRGARTMPVLDDDDPNIGLLLRGL